MMGCPRKAVSIAEFQKMYEDGIKIKEITRRLGISKSLVHKIRVEQKIPVRRWRIKFDEKRFRQLFDEDLTYTMMAKKLGISIRVVMTIRKRLNLSNRKRGRKAVLR